MLLRCLLLALVLAVLPVAAAPLLARDREARPPGHAPQKNFSFIHDETEWIVRAFDDASAAIDTEDWVAVIRALQPVIDQVPSRESPGQAAPYVRAVHGTSVYEGAWLVARHTLQGLGAEALAAYGREFGGTAHDHLVRAATQRDTALLERVARRFLGLPAGRRAALLLVDVALERGDRETALGWLESLEDLEAVSAETDEVLAPWRKARIQRQALLLAKDEASRPAVAKALATVDVRSDAAIDAVPAALRWRPPTVRTWPTTGGASHRGALAPAMGGSFSLRWFRGRESLEHLVDTADPKRIDHDRPSLWLPPRAVASETHLFVSDGESLHIYDLATGTPVLTDAGDGIYPGARRDGIGTDTSEDRRIRFGLLEGHALSLHPVRSFAWQAPWERKATPLGAGWLVLAAVPDGDPWDWDRTRSAGHRRRDDHLQAFHFDGKRLRALWRAGGTASPAERGGLPNDTRLYGAPIVVGQDVWIGGIRAAKATKDRWEAWLYSFDLHTGRVRTSTHLGTGTPMRTGRMDEVIPTSPAAARGRIVLGTALGILASVDTVDGRVRWIYRYDRAVDTERGAQRNRDRRDKGLRRSSFANEPPILTQERCYVTPTDGNKVLVLFDRPRAKARHLRSREIVRDLASAHTLIEHIAGVDPRPREGRTGSLALIGKGESGTPPGAIVTVWDARTPDRAWPSDREAQGTWEGIAPTGFGARPYGRALLTAGEIFVPQEHGIAVFELEDTDRDGSHFLTLLGQAAIPKALRAQIRGKPYGNLIPIPGKGLVAVNATSIAFWAKQ